MKIIYFNQNYHSNNVSVVSKGIVLCPHPWLAFKKGFNRFVCHLVFSPKANSILKMPFKQFWVKKVLHTLGFNNKEEFAIVINAHYYQMISGNIIDYVKKQNTNNAVLFTFSDKVDTFLNLYKDFPSLDYLKEYCDAILTYNTKDATKPGFSLDRPCIPFYPPIPNKLGDFSSDVFFIGRKKDRLSVIHKIYEQLNSLGLKCDFYIFDVEKEERIKGSSIHYNVHLTYQDVLEHCQKTKAILNIVQNSGEGITARDYEAIFFNKYYLTNNYAIKTSLLYNPKQVIFLNEIDERVRQIKTPLGSNNTANLFNFDNWKAFIEHLIREKRNYDKH